jgi:hypothetical protein
MKPNKPAGIVYSHASFRAFQQPPTYQPRHGIATITVPSSLDGYAPA